MSNLPHVAAPLRLKSRPDRIFVSVDQSTGRSAISFSPADAGNPIVHDDDRTGALAMIDAKSLAETYQGSTIHGPYFHAARPAGRKRLTRKPSGQKPGAE